MTAQGGLEQGYRWLLRCYPPSYRDRHGEEILGVLLAAAQPGQRRPGVRASLDLLWSALQIRIRLVLRGADSQPWAAALALAGVLIPLLMLVLKLAEFLIRGAFYGFGTPADVLIGAYGEPGTYARIFQLNPYSIALTGNVTDALTAGPVPALILAVLVCLGWRRAAASFAAFIPLAYLGITLTSGYTLVGDWRGNVTVYAYGLEALILLAAPGSARGWRALRWRPSVLAAVATVAAVAGMNGGIGPLFYQRPAHPVRALIRMHLWLEHRPRGYVDQLLGIGAGGWGDWLLYQGTMVTVIAVMLTAMLVSSPVSRRVLYLLAVPFAFGLVIYLCNLLSPQLPASAGNSLAALPLLLILLAAMACSLVNAHRTGPDVPRRPAAPGGA